MGIGLWIILLVVVVLFLWGFIRWFWGGVLLRRFKAWRDRMSILYHRRQDVPITNGEKVVLENGVSRVKRMVVLNYESDLKKGRIKEYYDESGTLCVKATEKMKNYQGSKRGRSKKNVRNADPNIDISNKNRKIK